MQGVDIQNDLFKASLARLREVAREKRLEFLKGHKRWVKDEEKALRKKFGIKEKASGAVDVPSATREVHPRSRKKAKKHHKTGFFKEAVFVAVQTASKGGNSFTIGALVKLLVEAGIVEPGKERPARAAIYTTLKRHPDRVRIKRRGDAKTETLWEAI